MTPTPYSVEAVKAAMITRAKTIIIDGKTRPVVNGRPLTVHNPPLIYLETRNGERRHDGQMNSNVYRIAVCTCVALHDNSNAEAEIDRLINVVVATIETSNLSLKDVWNNISGETWDVDDFEIGETNTRRLTWIFRITAKGARGTGL